MRFCSGYIGFGKFLEELLLQAGQHFDLIAKALLEGQHESLFQQADALVFYHQCSIFLRHHFPHHCKDHSAELLDVIGGHEKRDIHAGYYMLAQIFTVFHAVTDSCYKEVTAESLS
ncbi:hypothetical protein AH97_24365 [Salmonella enterica subsp. enterica]|nr:hypothetical protein [Salmonella enterica subsp. enterica serovar Hartford]